MEERFVFKKHKIIFKMVLVAIFAALNFVVMLFPKIPIPSLVGHPYVHLGNLVVILTSVYFGGVVGGLAGAIGMGTYDLVTGYGIWTLKTVVLKFGIGIVTGLVYRLVKNKNDKGVRLGMIYTGSFFLVLGLLTGLLAFLQGGTLIIGGKEIALSWPLYVFSFILGLILVLAGILSKGRKIEKMMFASSMGIVFNIVGELCGGFLKKVLTGNGVRVSMAMSIASIPATIINGCVVLFVAFVVFPGLNTAFSKLDFGKQKEVNEQLIDEPVEEESTENN